MLRSMFGLFIACVWTLGTFVGGFVAGAPFGEIVLITSFVAYITGLVHFVCLILVARKAKYPFPPRS